MNRRIGFGYTRIACYLGFIGQAIANNFAPLLFLTFQKEFDIPLSQIALLASINFVVQLAVDYVGGKTADKIGYRACMLIAHVSYALGIAGLAFLPQMFSQPFVGLLIAVFLYGVGGGLCEVLVSPIIEACPSDNKAGQMSLLHSFYCWGVVAVMLLSTAFFAVFGLENWRILCWVWAVVPFANIFLFAVVPINRIVEVGEGMSMGQLMKSKLFWLLALLMVTSGASEISMSQWASAYTESALGVSKAVGDLAGPCLFAALMGVARVFYAKFSDRVDLTKLMLASGVLCAVCYLLASVGGIPVLGLLGCGLCGLAAGIMWPGTLNIATSRCPTGGTAMFALLALAGDVGASAGPALVGRVYDMTGSNLCAGVLSAAVFPIVMIGGLIVLRKSSGR